MFILAREVTLTHVKGVGDEVVMLEEGIFYKVVTKKGMLES